MAYQPYKITVYSAIGETHFTGYGHDLAEAAAGVAANFRSQHPAAEIYDMTAPFRDVPRVW
jgi:hypothetical protein